MELYYYWLIAAIILVIVEIATAGFGSICFAFGALASALVSYLGLSLYWQLAVFAAISFLSFMFLRPVFLKFIDRKSQDQPTNADALVGKKAVVSETIDPVNHTGRVAIDGDDWKAVSEDGSLIDKGAEVVVVKLDSIILSVKRQ